jgi:hypothetical protein
MTIIARQKRGIKPEGLKEIYPSEYAKRAKKRIIRVHNKGRGPDAEPRHIHCAQCGADIPDYANLQNCWHCGSDNFLGKILWP